LFVALLLAVVCLSGCRPKEVLGPVQGKVTFQGQPVTQGMIVFCSAQKGVYITAPVSPEGTYEVAMANGYGLPPGEYQVAVTPPIDDLPVEQQYGPITARLFPNIPMKYRYADSSGLTMTVKREGNRFDVDMKP
jgi:hypothetical protein